MSSSSREEIAEVLEAIRYDWDRLCTLTFDVLTGPERIGLLETVEQVRRQLRTPEHAVINQLAEQSTDAELGGTLRSVLADRLHITLAEASRRIAEAKDLGPRRALSGEPLPPQLTATATAQSEGKIGDGHIKVIRDFLRDLPAAIDLGTRVAAEEQLAKLATTRRPDDLSGLADQLMLWLNPDGKYSDEERARKRGIALGKQESDGMSRLSGLVNPELRVTIEAVLAKLAQPGACNPDDETPVVDEEPDQDAVRRDTRSKQQRNHDGVLAGLRALLASGDLGKHRGLPVSIVVTTSLKDLEAAAGTAASGGGSRVPMSDVIRLAAHAHHYLAIFDDGKPLALYHTKRLASPAQRMVLCAKDRGCTTPGCDAPAYHSEVHHVTGWTNTHRTDINDLTLACGPHNRLAEKGWTTRTNAHGETEWLPPPNLDHGRPRINRYHHPEKILGESDDDEPD